MRYTGFWSGKSFYLYVVLCVLILSQLFMSLSQVWAFNPSLSPITADLFAAPPVIRLDHRLPAQQINEHSQLTNINAKFASRFDFNIHPGHGVYSGTEGIFHDQESRYVMGVRPDGQRTTYMFQTGTLNKQLSDQYLLNQQVIQGLNTSRLTGNTPFTAGIKVTLDIIDTFTGEPGCIEITACAQAVKDDTVPVFIIGIQLENFSQQQQNGNFLFGSNRPLPTSNACNTLLSDAKTPVTTLAYAPQADASGGTLFLAGDQHHWSCTTSLADRAGLDWHYQLAPHQHTVAYMLVGGWNASQHVLVNSYLPAYCQEEGLYYTREWNSKEQVIAFAIDNLFTRDNLLWRAQTMENLLIGNQTLTPQQRWLIGDTLRSYKADSWLTARPQCAGGGYDATVYEGTYGFLSTIDVMHEYGYFEISRVPWFFKSAMTMVFTNATRNRYGLYFQHDQGGEVDAKGNCVKPGKGIPTFRSTCYTPPYVEAAFPMPTEENDNVALLMAYYFSVTADFQFVRQHLNVLNLAMWHNLRVGDPETGIAANGRDTVTTYDAANDCLHNSGLDAGNLYYQGLKEATAYLATDFLNMAMTQTGNQTGTEAENWHQAAEKIEMALLAAKQRLGYIPIGSSQDFSNCAGRTIMLGDGLFYLHLSGLDQMMKRELLTALAQQYPEDVRRSTSFVQPLQHDRYQVPATWLTSQPEKGSAEQCAHMRCRRYSWYSKVMLSGFVADMLYSQYGCKTCQRLNLVQAAYAYNMDLSKGYSDGIREGAGYWAGFFYPRGIISWAYLDPRY